MRDIERIPRILDLLQEEWKANPDQRLGQLIINVARSGHTGKPDYYDFDGDDLWEYEDNLLEFKLATLARFRGDRE